MSGPQRKTEMVEKLEEVDMTQEKINYAIIKNAVNIIAVVNAANPDKIIDLLSKYLWEPEEVDGIKESSGEMVIS